MKPKLAIRSMVFAVAVFTLIACGGGGGEDGAPRGSSNWGEMKWDQDKWS